MICVYEWLAYCLDWCDWLIFMPWSITCSYACYIAMSRHIIFMLITHFMQYKLMWQILWENVVFLLSIKLWTIRRTFSQIFGPRPWNHLSFGTSFPTSVKRILALTCLKEFGSIAIIKLSKDQDPTQRVFKSSLQIINVLSKLWKLLT